MLHATCCTFCPGLRLLKVVFMTSWRMPLRYLAGLIYFGRSRVFFCHNSSGIPRISPGRIDPPPAGFSRPDNWNAALRPARTPVARPNKDNPCLLGERRERQENCREDLAPNATRFHGALRMWWIVICWQQIGKRGNTPRERLKAEGFRRRSARRSYGGLAKG